MPGKENFSLAAQLPAEFAGQRADSSVQAGQLMSDAQAAPLRNLKLNHRVDAALTCTSTSSIGYPKGVRLLSSNLLVHER